MVRSTAASETRSSGPLRGVRVIDMASVVMGPYAAQILGDLGAEVIKIESPNDNIHHSPMHKRTPGMSPLHLNVNRNKRSISLNLKDPADRDRALRLIGNSDVLITNMRIGALQRLGLDHESIAAEHPHLIYAHAQGFRPDSDRANLAAYDETVQAASGMIDLAQRAADLNTPAVLPSIFADKITALTIAYSVLAALVHQRETGRGQLVEVPMTDTMLSFNMIEHLQGEAFDPPLGPTGFPLSMTKGHRARPTRDGLAMIMPYTPQNFRDLFAAAGRGDLAQDPRLDQDRLDPQTDGLAMIELLESVTPELTTDQWAEICDKHSVPFGPVLRLDDAAEDDYVREGHLLDTAEHPSEGNYRVVGIPMSFSATPADVRRHAPIPGEHTGELLAELDSQERS